MKNRVYAYLSAEHALQDIVNGHLKMSEAHRTNDPFEYYFELLFQQPEHFSGEWCEAAEKWFDENIVANSNGMPFVSFSDSFKSLPLWAYYGERHKGICLGFDFEFEIDGGPLLRKVSYPQKRIRFEVPDQGEKTETSNEQKFLDNLFWTKDKQWLSENEWRLCVPSDNHLVETTELGYKFLRFPKNALTEICFGLSCPDEIIGKVLLACHALEMTPHCFRMEKVFKSRKLRGSSIKGRSREKTAVWAELGRPDKEMTTTEKNRYISRALLSLLIEKNDKRTGATQ